MTFGDLATGLLLKVVENVLPVAAAQIRDKAYIDVMSLGGDRADMARMKGNKLANGQSDSIVTQILATYGMVPKFLAVSRNKDPAEAAPMMRWSSSLSSTSTSRTSIKS